MNAVIFPTILNQNNVSAANIGIAFATDIFGGIIMSFFLHKLVKKIGMMKALALSSLGYAAATSLIYFYQNFFLWLTFAFFMGNCFFVYSITRQAWMNILLTSHRRAVALGIFSMIFSSGLALGPVIVKFSGAENYLSFLISSGITIISFLCLTSLKKSAYTKISEERIPLKEFFQKNPRCFLARFFLDFQSYLLLTFTVIFGKRIGLSYEQSGLLITVFMASAFFDVLIGFALKKISAYKMINIGFLGCIYCLLSIILYHQSYIILLITYFIFGIFIACIYVSVFKITNDDYEKHKLVAANSTFQLIGSSGSLCGSLIGGLLIDIFGIYGFPITLILSSVFYLTFLVTYEKK